MKMTVYVGRDVEVKLQVPAVEDVSSQADGTNTVFTVSHTPISDRDMDGVADEPEHVTVYVDGVEATVSAVDDDQGQITLASAPAQGSKVIIEYMYDLEPYVAQELTLEPKQHIEGIDGLGSDTVQIWAPLLKEINGSIKETFKPGTMEQWHRIQKRKRLNIYSQQFWDSTALDDFDGHTANFSIDSQELLVNTDDWNAIWLKESVVPKFYNGIIRSKIYHCHGGEQGWVFRRFDLYNFYRVCFDGLRRLKIIRTEYPGGDTTLLLTSESVIPESEWKTVEIRFFGNKIEVQIDSKVYSVIDDDPLLYRGSAGFYAYFGQNGRYDDFQVWKETGPAEYGMIVTFDHDGSTIKLGLNGVVFPEGSLPAPKNEPVYIITPFKAKRIKVIT